MEIGKDKVVTMAYELRTGNENGDMVESTGTDKPAVFLFGAGILLPQFEGNLNGKKPGDKFSFGITADNAYGVVSKEYIMDLPKDAFKIDEEIDKEILTVGNVIPMQDEKGNHLNGTVTAVGEDAVTMDFNHPLAGEDLFFSGEVMEIREASDEEKNHGHVHGPEGHHH